MRGSAIIQDFSRFRERRNPTLAYVVTVLTFPQLAALVGTVGLCFDWWAPEEAANEPVDEEASKELASMLERIPREGRLQINSVVNDGMPAVMRIVRDGHCYEFKCNYVGIPQEHEGILQVQLMRKIVGLSNAWSQCRGVGTCDREGNVRIFT